MAERIITEGVRWDYFDKFDYLIDKYLPRRGEGENMATQAVTAANKLIYEWYNNGGAFDNNYGFKSFWNDVSCYANWLYANVEGADKVLSQIYECKTRDEYEHILKDIADLVFDESLLTKLENNDAEGSVYEKGMSPFSYGDEDEDDDDEEYEDDE